MATAAPTQAHVLPLRDINTVEEAYFASKLWMMRSQERNFWRKLPLQDREIFREFLIGYKIVHYAPDDGAESDEDEVEYPRIVDIVDHWNNTNAQEKERLIRAARRHQNPIHRALRTWNLSRYDENDQFHMYLLGIELNRLRLLTEEEMIARYPHYHAAVGTLHLHASIDRVRATLADYRALRLKPSAEGSHRYQAGQLPPPTQGDDEFIRQQFGAIDTALHLNPSDNWLFERTIYQNRASYQYHRIVHLYARTNEDGNLEYRRVVKIQGYQTNEEATEETRDEFETHRRLSPGVQADFILQCYGSSVRSRPGSSSQPRWLGYGFLEYAPFGSMYDLVTAKQNEGVNRFYIPEFLIWRTFLGMVTALYNMEMGVPLDHNQTIDEEHLESNTAFRRARKAQNWRPIINLDIKTQNIVFGEPQPPYPAFPTPKLIDFGHAHVAAAPDQYPTFNEDPGGTPGWKPPEHARFEPYFPPDPPPSTEITVATHIFNIGLIILNLMESDHLTYGYPFISTPWHLAESYSGMYSYRLEMLVLACLSFRASDRPTLAKLFCETMYGSEQLGLVNPFADPRGIEEADLHPGFRLPFPQEHTAFMGHDYPVENGRRRQAEEGAN